jgi:heterodisulfide reductase subunit C
MQQEHVRIAIALAQRYNLDSRDGAREERAETGSSTEGIWECTFIGECSRVCPTNVDPAGAIQQAKAINTQEWRTIRDNDERRALHSSHARDVVVPELLYNGIHHS